MPDLAQSGAEKPLTEGILPAGRVRQGCAYRGHSLYSRDLPLAAFPPPGGWWTVKPDPFLPVQTSQEGPEPKGFPRLARPEF